MAENITLNVGGEQQTYENKKGIKLPGEPAAYYVNKDKLTVNIAMGVAQAQANGESVGEVHAITAGDMNGAVTVEAAAGKAVAKIGSGVAAEAAVTLGYADGKVAAKVGGTTAVEKTAEALGIPAVESAPQLASYIGKCTMVKGPGTSSTDVAGSMSIVVPKETVDRSYVFITPQGRRSNEIFDLVFLEVKADNTIENAGACARVKNTSNKIVYMTQAPSGWSITDNGDDTLTIASAPTTGTYSWWYYTQSVGRDFYCYRIDESLSVVGD